ncbi:MAG: S41 family peptidase [Gemmatimonadaceae bacterium]
MTDPIPDAPEQQRRGLRAVVATVVLVALLAAGGWYAGHMGSTATQSVTAARPKRSPVAGTHLFDQVMAAISQRYVDSIDVSTLYEKAVSGMLAELGDPYTSFLTETRLKSLDEGAPASYGGVGLQVNRRDGSLTVIEPIAGSPAAKAGVQAGDRLVAIDGTTTFNMVQEDAARALRGSPGSKVALTLERAGIPKRIQLTLVRDSVHRRSVSRTTILANGVGYVDVTMFSDKTVEELSQSIDSLTKVGAKSIIMDMRGNSSGTLAQGSALAELFLDPGQVIVQLRSRPGAPPNTYADREVQKWPSLAIGILLDRGSAGAAEVVGGALQDHDRAIVVGTTSFGKGSAQSVISLADGSGLRLTTERWFTSSGRGISRLTRLQREIENGDVPLTPKDTVKPVFKSDAGRKIVGGGGITPDVQAADSVAPEALQELMRVMGNKLPTLRDAIGSQALQIKSSGKFTSAGAPVTREYLDGLYADLVRRKSAPDRPTFDAASPWVGRSFGYEIARVTFGPDAEFARRSQDDVALQKAVQLLQGSRSPREVFAHLESQQKVEVQANRQPNNQ